MRCYCRQRATRGPSSPPLATIALFFSGLDVTAASIPMRSYTRISSSAFVGGDGASTRYNDQPAAAFVAHPAQRKRPRQYDTSFTSIDIFPTYPSSSLAPLNINHRRQHQTFRRTIASTTTPLYAKPKSGSVVDSYQTVSVNCSKCLTRLFRYKKKNGTKSNLIKCYIERISEDTAGIVQSMLGGTKGDEDGDGDGVGEAPVEEQEGREWSCPDCGQRFGRRTLIHGRPAIKLVGGKVRMTKK